MLALYRKYRSQNFDQIVGQNQVTDILKLAIKNNRISHGYLLVGPRGVGKTSVARILAYAINKIPYDLNKNHIDIIEIDAASNTSVENIRDLIDKSYVTPNFAKYKIYIIDEVHMLSKSAFNAFLKLLEEPPKHVIFILATTDEHKVPETIVSRTQRFVFKKIDDHTIAKQLQTIADAEKIAIDETSLLTIAKTAKGGLRDAINLLDQIAILSDGSKINPNLVNTITGTIPEEKLQTIIDAYQSQDFAKILASTNELLANNFSSVEIANQLTSSMMTDLADNPNNLKLLQGLLKVNRSAMPDVELIIALGNFALDKPAKKVTLAKPTKPIANAQKVSTSDNNSQIVEPSPKIATVATADLDVAKLFEAVKKQSIGLFSAIKGADVLIENDNLIFSIKNNFYFKQATNSKNFQLLQVVINSLGLSHLQLNIVQTTVKNDKISSVIDIMGGGEEVSLDD